MNIFVLHTDPKKAAQYQADKHCVKMVTESTMILSTALNSLGIAEDRLPYPPKFKNYPICLWPTESTVNLGWLFRLAREQAKEYSFRYGREHKCHSMILDMAAVAYPNYDFWRMGDFQIPDNFVQAMPNKYKVTNDAVQAYRNYYRKEKRSFARWNNGRDRPAWMNQQQKLF